MTRTDERENKIRSIILSVGCICAALGVPLWAVLIVMDIGPVIPSHFYVAFHAAIELFSVVVAACIFIVGWHMLDVSRPRASVLLACGFLAVAMFDAAHLLSSQGMPDFITANSLQKSNLFWLFARVTAVAALLVYVLSPRQVLTSSRPSRYRYLTVTLILIVMVGGLTLFYPRILPSLFAVDTGFTVFGILMELLVVALMLTALLVTWNRTRQKMVQRQPSLMLSVLLMAIGESFFLVNGYGQELNAVVGHVYKALAFIYLYRAVFMDSVRLPVDRLLEAHRAVKSYARQNDELLAHAPDAIVGVNQRGQIVFINHQLEEMFGYHRNELVGAPVEMLLPISTRERHTQLREGYQLSPVGRPMSTTKGLAGRHKDGREIPVDIALGSHEAENGTQVTAFIRDVSDRQRMENEMRHRATHDVLTGLPNRALMQDRLDLAMIHARRYHGGCALLMVDLDNFKEVNDGWGHSMGDRVLVMAAKRITRALREGDSVARFGGDEFVVLVTGRQAPEAVKAIADKIMTPLKNAFIIGPQQFHISASIGIACFPQHAQDAETLLSNADIAMYRAKLMGRSAVCMFDESMGLHQQESQKLRTWLNEAMLERQMQLYYQPQYSVSDGAIVGFEALLRWHHPDLGWISPDVFIPVAEASGLIMPLTDWVLETAAEQIRIWSDLGLPTRISVNVSALHFRQHNVLLATVRKIVQSHGIQPNLLGLEITETALMDESDMVVSTLRQLVALGVHMSIDDFGTGYSSLASLQLFPLHTLKIDGSFMHDLHDNTRSAALVSGLINLAKSLDLEVMAECVETAEQLEILRLSRCDVIQGWLMNPALTGAECTVLLAGTHDVEKLSGD
ncbi:hypothetical protein LCGC14_0023140 [marine sediment metagenome]|uniref:Uncharacterized protein n=2 Tax=root TaxID=1 RepID=A0A0F9W0N6_9ZZZZ|nr:EAL domain-containing protein [Pseudohongiella sp.]HEA61921.1 EAL domain-containing protein [Pseudohongiella sp.]